MTAASGIGGGEFIAWMIPRQQRIPEQQLCWVASHEWHGKVGGYICRDCRREIATVAEMSTLPKCAPKIVPVSWLPRAPVVLGERQ